MIDRIIKIARENIGTVFFFEISILILGFGFYFGVIRHPVEIASVVPVGAEDSLEEETVELLTVQEYETIETITEIESSSETTTEVIQIDDTPGVIVVPNLVPAGSVEEDIEFTTKAQKEAESEDKVTLSVSCGTILDNMDKLDKTKASLVGDGNIFESQEVELKEGDTVFSLLERELVMNGIHFEYNKTTNIYIEGINNIYEFDCGELSGWMYKVNGEFYSMACDEYVLEPGDVVEWVYTCDLGRDVGNNYTEEATITE